MRSLIVMAGLAALGGLLVSSWGESQDRSEARKTPSSNQLLMRDKLDQIHRVFEGLTLDRFDQVRDSAETLRSISQATSWHITEPTPQYKRLLKNFQEQSSDLERHAEERNTEAATLDLVRMQLTCLHCHQHMREEAARRR